MHHYCYFVTRQSWQICRLCKKEELCFNYETSFVCLFVDPKFDIKLWCATTSYADAIRELLRTGVDGELWWLTVVAKRERDDDEWHNIIISLSYFRFFQPGVHCLAVIFTSKCTVSVKRSPVHLEDPGSTLPSVQYEVYEISANSLASSVSWISDVMA